ncbi:hypothetical protein TR13x_10830 [Caloranaerobacter sp. TR13]|nr:hypothetical protein TR13x_10830 [Caloranaerobacter sp. TR13]
MMNKQDGFIMDLWEKIFSFLSKISIFTLLRFIRKRMGKEITYTFVDSWVLGNLILSILSSIIVYNLTSEYEVLLFIIFGYGVLRVFEVIIYQINVLLFDPYRCKKQNKPYKIKSKSRMVLLLLHNYVEIMFWYSTMMITLVVLILGKVDNSWMSYIRSNILCIVTFDSNVVIEATGKTFPYLYTLAFYEIMSGIIMTVISLARFVGILPDVEEIDS